MTAAAGEAKSGALAGKGYQPIPGGYTAISEYEVCYTFPGDIPVRGRTTRDKNGFSGIINADRLIQVGRFVADTADYVLSCRKFFQIKG
jgi:hypothetical protein